MKILLIGGAGYIGSHMAKQLVCSGYDVVNLDNLSTGYKKLARYGKFVIGDLADTDCLEKLFTTHKFSAVMHFAANSLVAESIRDPAKYYKNNVANTINLLDVMLRHDVKNFIFSSTAATFGEPEYIPIDEKHLQKPINPYGSSKLMVERLLEDYSSAYGLNSVCLRYFNACGADPDGELGECHDPETHLIPLILQVASGRRDFITVFGRDYPTEDGTCIRDYIHINDLCDAHARALELIVSGKKNGALVYNLGNGKGFSVQQVIEIAKKITAADGIEIKLIDGERRAGDPAVLVADSKKAERELQWKPKYQTLDEIILHAWVWEREHNISFL